MTSIGMLPKHAEKLANLLVLADRRGHHSHGLNRLPMYRKEVKEGIINLSDATPTFIKQTPAIAYLDGQNLCGAVSAEFAMKLCIEKAQTVGIGFVCMKNTNHFGIAGKYGLMAVESGLIGMAMTQTSPLVVPTRSCERVLGTNPIAFFAGDYQLDMATSTVAWGKIEMKRRLDQDLPSGWAVNSSGKNENESKKAAGLTALGGAEMTGGYKGYGLSAMVEILCGVLSGGIYGKQIRRWQEQEDGDWKESRLSQCFVCINPEFFSENFEEDLQEFAAMLRGCEKSGDEDVIIPGDRANGKFKETEDSDVITISKGVIDQIHKTVCDTAPMKIE